MVVQRTEVSSTNIFLFQHLFIKLIINESINKLLRLEYRQLNVDINIPLILKKITETKHSFQVNPKS